jgi:hypothetical protein
MQILRGTASRRDHRSGVGLWSVFTRQGIPFVLNGASEKDISLMQMMRVPCLLADSLEEAAGTCKAISPTMRDKDAGAFGRIWVEHRKAFYARNGRTPPERELPSARVAELCLGAIDKKSD